jgi:ABC-2 type transport system permease protein
MGIAATARQRVAETFSESVYDNPVLMMGFRTRMRKATGFMIMGGYVLFLAVVLLIAWYTTWNWTMSRSAAMANATIGLTLFTALSITQAWLFLFIVPALTSGAMTQELERRTMELLVLTPLTSGKIILGKHLSAFLYCFGLLVCSIPLAGVCLMMGGISPMEIAVTYALLAAWCFLLASAGVFWSSLFRATAAAVLFTYGSCFVYMMVTTGITAAGMAQSMAMRYAGGGPSGNTFALVGLNPMGGPTLAMLTAKVCGLSVPVALVAFVLHVAVGALLLFVAMTHVLYHRTQKALPVRVLLLFTSLGLIWLVVGNGLTLAPSYGNLALGWLEGVVAVLLPLLCLAAPMFTTGPLTKPEGASVFAYALSPRKLLRSDLGGGLSFMLLWGAAAYAVFGLTFWWTQLAMPSMMAVDFWSTYFTTGIAFLAIIAGISCVGVLASCVMQNRRNAAAISVLFIIMMFGGYLIALIYYTWGPFYNSGIHGSNSPIYQLSALWPMTPALSVLTWKSPDFPALWWPKEMSWLISSVAYLSIAVISLLLATPAARRWGGVKED